MGQDFYQHSPAARRVLDATAEMAGIDLLTMLFEGPAEKLNLTENAQPALVAVEVAIARHLEFIGVQPSVCAGHSVGEFAALVLVGAMEFEDAFALVQARGRCMADGVPDGSMMAVLMLDVARIEAALTDGAYIANYNGPSQTIIAGTKSALEKSTIAMKEAGARRVLPVKVSGPFHSPLMKNAEAAFQDKLKSAKIVTPTIPFVSSVTGKHENDPETIRELLARQICAPIRWTHVFETIGSVPAVECGPGKALQGIAKRMDNAPDVRVAGTFEEAAQLEVAK
jgi:[acyl-carrier-protein] S-malonyltransferase